MRHQRNSSRGGVRTVNDLAVFEHLHRVLDAARDGVAIAGMEFVDRAGDGLAVATADHVTHLLMRMGVFRSIHASLKSHPRDHRALANREQIKVHTEGLPGSRVGVDHDDAARQGSSRAALA